MMDSEQILLKLLRTIAKEHRYNEADIQTALMTCESVNYTSAIYLATISAKGKEILQIFAKVASLEELMREKPGANIVYATERFFYTKLRKTFDGIQDKHYIKGCDRLAFPKFYGCNSTRMQETIVLENLMARGYNTSNQGLTLEREYATAAVTALAKWHSLSFAYKRDEPEEFERVLNEQKSLWLMQKDVTRKYRARLLANAMEAVEERHKLKVQKYVADQVESEKYYRFVQPSRHPVLAHGDYKSSNLLSRKEDDGRLSVIPVDYQTIQAGRIATDLLYFIYTGADKHFIIQHFHQLTEHYYLELTQALQRMDMEVSVVYPREVFDEEIRDTLSFGGFVGLFLLPIVIAEPRSAPKFEKGMESLMMIPKKGYAERLNGLLDSLEELGVELWVDD